MSEQKNKKTEETLKYDSRKKKLYRVIKEEGQGGVNMGLGELKDCKYTIKNEQEYGVDAIKKIWGELKNQRDELNKTLEKSNRTLDAVKDIEDDEELRHLSEQLQKLQKVKKKYEAEEQQKYALEQLRAINKQMSDLKQAVKEHVKLE